MKNKLNKNNVEFIKSGLSKYRNKLLPLPIFLEIYKIVVLTTVEIVPLIKNGDSIKVLLTKRGANDPTWPNLYHIPGTVLRSSDKIGSFADAYKRILINELKNIKTLNIPTLIEPILRDLGRGKEVTLLHWTLIKNKPSVGRLFDINNLPKNIIRPQIKYIKLAVKHFEENYKN